MIQQHKYYSCWSQARNEGMYHELCLSTTSALISHKVNVIVKQVQDSKLNDILLCIELGFVHITQCETQYKAAQQMR